MRGTQRDTTALALGSVISGLLAYLVFALTTRALGPEAAAPVSVLWSYWSFAGAAFTFPLQHWIASSVAAHGEGVVKRTLPRISLVVVVTSLLLGGLAWIGREPLFHRADLWFPSMVVLVTLGSALIGVVRGGLSASGRFIGLACSLVAENAVRCVTVGMLMLVNVRAAAGYGFCIVAGHSVAVFWPASLRFGRRQTSQAAHNPFAFLSGAATAQLLGQIVLTGGPVLLALAGGTPGEVTALFAALAIFRAPYIVALGLVSQLTGRITSMAVDGDAVALRRIRNVVLGTTVVAVVVVGVAGAWIGPMLLKLIFGSEVSFDPGQAALVAVGCTLGVANLVVTVSVVAQGRPRAVAWSWVVAVVAAGVVFAALSALSPIEQTLGCFLTAEAVAFGALLLVEQPRKTHATA
ncbi:MAG TPA: hypothetical protein VFD59_10675 [Nocardioidaceae bacterium]|nr:hypothetical protein [Nocardioidaceae bacterium]